ncbi:MAG TPA: lipid-binding SYLF domain-containing protein [Syntrophorhabdaceae bacterium]
MNRTRRHSPNSTILCMVICLIAGIMTLPALADDAAESRQIVEKAVMTFDNFSKAPEMEGFRRLMKDARGIFIAPQVLKGAFIVGAAGGSGLFVARDGGAGKWAGPAFYTIGEVSFGLQAGGQSSEVIFLAMSERGVTALLNNSVKLGGDVGVAAGPVGIGAAASTANLSADIISFSRSKGLFGGISLDGAVVAVRAGLNEAYYGGKKLGPVDILIRGTASPTPGARILLDGITEAAKK